MLSPRQSLSRFPLTCKGLLLLAFCFAVYPAVAQEREPLEIYASRRAALRQALPDGMIILFGQQETEGSEAYFRFRQENNFYYLTGHDEPGATLVMNLSTTPANDVAAAPFPPETLYLPRKNLSQSQWTGPKADPSSAGITTETGFATVQDDESFERDVRGVSPAPRILYTLLADPHGAETQQALARERVAYLKKLFPSADVRDARKALADLRQLKSDSELALIRKAVDCTIRGLRAAASELRPGLMEYQSAAMLKFTFEREGCLFASFDPIIASGPRSTILHYNRNTARMESGDLVIMDVGAEFSRYAADITRTFPVAGKFSPRQQEIYEIVLAAQKAAIAAVKPGAKFSDLQKIAYDYINSHGKDSKGDRLGKYFTHGLSHHVGIDVHDLANPSATLQPGMVITVEPGIYLPDENLGVRIEDMLLVTIDGSTSLTDSLPRDPADIEALVGQ